MHPSSVKITTPGLTWHRSECIKQVLDNRLLDCIEKDLPSVMLPQQPTYLAVTMVIQGECLGKNCELFACGEHSVLPTYPGKFFILITKIKIY